MSERIEKCKTCKFWERSRSMKQLGDGGFYQDPSGKCHISQPPACASSIYWPPTNEWDWCGQWQPNRNDHAGVFADYLEEQGEPTAAEKLRKFNQQ